jgi:hypothetical protein
MTWGDIMQCVCGGSLEPGFIPDFSQQAVWTTTWIAGAPDTSKPLLEVLRTGAGVRVKGSMVRSIEAFRCTACGRLELYARAEPDPSATPARSS